MGINEGSDRTATRTSRRRTTRRPAKRGRPPLPAGERRRATNLSLSPAAIEALGGLADRLGRSRGQAADLAIRTLDAMTASSAWRRTLAAADGEIGPAVGALLARASGGR